MLIKHYLSHLMTLKIEKLFDPNFKNLNLIEIKGGVAMSTIKLQSNRAGCKDVFKAFLVKNAKYEGELEIPVIKGIKDVPNKLISFIDAMKNSTKDFNQWVHFYIDDFHFEKIWNRPKVFIKKLKKFNGVILPDFSIYRDMPLVMQHWNIYRSRAIGNYLQSNGIKVITNIRYGDERTYECACLGAPHKSIIAIGTNGTIQNKIDRNFLDEGFDYIVKILDPKVIVIYGGITKHIQKVCDDKKIRIVNFRSEQYKRYGGN